MNQPENSKFAGKSAADSYFRLRLQFFSGLAFLKRRCSYNGVKKCSVMPTGGRNMPDSGIADFSEQMPTHGPPMPGPPVGGRKPTGILDTPSWKPNPVFHTKN